MRKHNGLGPIQAIKALRQADPLLCLKVDLLRCPKRLKTALLAHVAGFSYRELEIYFGRSKSYWAREFKKLGKG